MRRDTLRNAWSAFSKATPFSGKFVAAALLFLVAWALLDMLYTRYADFRADFHFNHLSYADHLRIAKSICHVVDTSTATTCFSTDTVEASRHLEKIASNAGEYAEASKLLTVIRNQEERIRAHERQALEKARSPLEQARSQTSFTCSSGYPKSCTKPDDADCTLRPIISLDNGATWVRDDGRCAAREQKKRDDDAEVYSYWPTTLRVDTDIDSSWLNDEERTCQTYPDKKGRVSVVACNASDSRKDHNIPVRFWGGVDRNTVSDWICRKEVFLLNQTFVCRAID